MTVDRRYYEYLGNTEDVIKTMKVLAGRRIKDFFDEQIKEADKARARELNRQLWDGGYKAP